MAKLTFATGYDRDRSDIGAIDNTEPSLTQQHFRDECDLNTIMSQYTQSGLVPEGTSRTALYGDFSQVDDYLTALNTIENARNQFNELPARARERFKNDPLELLAFLQNPDNKPEAQRLGLLKEEPPPPTPTPPPPTPATGNDGKGA